ncbi:MAG: hypothetical protein ACFHVJ_05635 [Aestuariibacter sp.]
MHSLYFVLAIKLTALDTLYFIYKMVLGKLWRKELAEINDEWKESPNID